MNVRLAKQSTSERHTDVQERDRGMQNAIISRVTQHERCGALCSTLFDDIFMYEWAATVAKETFYLFLSMLFCCLDLEKDFHAEALLYAWACASRFVPAFYLAWQRNFQLGVNCPWRFSSTIYKYMMHSVRWPIFILCISFLINHYQFNNVHIDSQLLVVSSLNLGFKIRNKWISRYWSTRIPTATTKKNEGRRIVYTFSKFWKSVFVPLKMG